VTWSEGQTPSDNRRLIEYCLRTQAISAEASGEKPAEGAISARYTSATSCRHHRLRDSKACRADDFEWSRKGLV
jgi:hypothetical protein